MKFQVPQFIEVEDKIFWKLTLKQFIYLAGGGGLCLILYVMLPFYAAILLILPVAAFSLALAFYQYNNRPFIFLIESASKYLINTRLYIWKKEDKPVPMVSVHKVDDGLDLGLVPKLSDSKLKDLTWALQAKQSLTPETEGQEKEA